jgi:hypothetical protein
LKSVDFPTFGLPRMEIKPDLKGAILINYKFQFPNVKQVPIINIQPPKLLFRALNFDHWNLFGIWPACATYLRPQKRGLRIGGSRFGEGRCL